MGVWSSRPTVVGSRASGSSYFDTVARFSPPDAYFSRVKLLEIIIDLLENNSSSVFILLLLLYLYFSTAVVSHTNAGFNKS